MIIFIKPLHLTAVVAAFSACIAATSAIGQTVTLSDGFAPVVNGTVRAAIVQDDGGIVVAGDFTQVEGQVRNRIARLLPDGRLDTTFDPDIDGSIRALVSQPDGKILVGGVFGSVSGVTVPQVARLHPDGSLDSSFSAIPNSSVLSLAVQSDGKILIGGNFTSIGGIPRSRFARLNPDGTVDSSLVSDADNSVHAIEVDPAGGIIVGGEFTEFGGEPRSRIARLTPSGLLDPRFRPDPNHSVIDIALQADGRILVGGLFTEVGGRNHSRLVRLSSSGEVDSSFSVSVDAHINTIAIEPAGSILIGGDFGLVNGEVRNRMARLSPGGILDSDFAPMPTGQVHTLVVDGRARILLGGVFTSVGSHSRQRIARLHSSGAVESAFNPNMTNGAVYCTTIEEDGSILACGSFTSIGGEAHSRIARIRSDGTVDHSFTASANDIVVSVSSQADGKILLAGWFTMVNGQPRSRIARLHPDGSLDLDFDPVANNRVYSTWEMDDGKLMVGGQFTSIAGHPRNHIARLHPDGTVDGGFNLHLVGSWTGTFVAEPGGSLIVGGQFSNILGTPRNNIARLRPDGTVDPSFNPDADNQVNGVAIDHENRVVVAGSFLNISGLPIPYLARFEADGTLDANFAPAPNGIVRSVTIQADGKLLVSGSFTSIAGQPRGRIARLNADGSLDTSFAVDATHEVSTIALEQDGTILAGGAFTTIGGGARGRLARITNGYVIEEIRVAAAGETLTWGRRGPVATLGRVAFEQSLDGGDSWQFLGEGIRDSVTSDWSLSDLNLPRGQNLLIRAVGTERGKRGNRLGTHRYRLVQEVYRIPPPEILSQPTSISQFAGTQVSFLVVAQADREITYQWRKDGENISGATGPSYTIASIAGADEGVYDVVLTNEGGSVTSNPVSLTLRAPFPRSPLKLKATDPDNGDRYGVSVDASGKHAIAGAWRDSERALRSGAAYVVDLETGNQKHKLTAADADADDWFGFSVGISGNRAIVGAYGDDEKGFGAGAAYVFNTDTGQQLFKLTGDDTADGDAFGYSVAICGNLAAVGAYQVGDQHGAVYIFDVETGRQLHTLTASDTTAGSYFAWSVALSGHRAIVGAPGDDEGRGGSGAAYVYDLTDGSELIKLKASDAGPGDELGFSVDISGDLAIAGAYYEESAGYASGAAYVFDLTQRNELYKFTPPDHQSFDRFGNDVAISGNVAVVGSIVRERITLYDLADGSFLREFTATDSNPDAPLYGRAVAIFGNLVLAGADQSDGPSSNTGAVYVHDIFETEITSHPESLTVNPGAMATLSVSANNGAPLSYQWRKDTIDIPGAVDSRLTLNSVEESDEGIYDVVIMGPFGSTTSDSASLSVNDPVEITIQPLSVTLDRGSSFVLSVTIEGTGPFSYQWSKDGADIPGATSSSYGVPSAQPWDIGEYSVRITNAVGTVTSATAPVLLNGVDPGIWRGLLAYFKLDGNGLDSSPFQIDAAEFGTVVYGTDRFGAPGAALDATTGISDADYLAGTGLDLVGTSHTVAFWVQTDYVGNGSNGQWILRVGSESSAGKALHIALDYGSPIRYSFFFDDFDTGESVSDREWHQVVATYDATTRSRRIYLDGELAASDIASQGFTGDGYFHFLGPEAPNIPVNLDDFRFYRRVLEPSEVANLFQDESLPSTSLALASSSDSGVSNTDRLTKIVRPEFEGVTKPGATVGLASSVDGSLGTAVADDSGSWSLQSAIDLSEGTHTIFVERGAVGDSIEIMLDVTPPSAPTGLALAAESDTGPSNQDRYTKDVTPTILGDSTEGVEIGLRSDLAGDVGSTAAAPQWSITTPTLSDGNHSLLATATDRAGNESAASPALSVTIDTMAPTVTVNQAAAQNDPTAVGPVAFFAAFSENVTGFGIDDPVIGGSVGGGAILSGVVGGPSSFTISVALQGTGEGTVIVSVPASTAIDAAGNASAASTSSDNVVVVDRHGSNGGSATSVPVSSGSGSIGGWLEATDFDYFSFTLAESQVVEIYTNGLTDTRGALYNTDNVLLNDPDADKNAGDGNNFRSSRVLTSGTYYVVVSNEGLANPGAYQLMISLEDVPILINETDAFTQSGDTREFVELFDGGVGNTALEDFVLVLFDGADDKSYLAIDLDGHSTDESGFFVIGNAATPNVGLVIPDGSFENGADAVALFSGSDAEFPEGTPVTSIGLVDAVVYDTGQADDGGLLALLETEEPQLDEATSSFAAGQSLQRIPNGAGKPRQSSEYAVLSPTPGAKNRLPDAPSGLDLHESSDTGASTSDDITSDTTPTITGMARAGSIVAITSDLDGRLGTAQASAGGVWSFTPDSALSEGTHQLTATADGGKASVALSITIDTTAPDAPAVPALSAASDTGPSDIDDYTSDNTPTITGDADTNLTVRLMSDLDGMVGTGTANSPWSITTSPLQDGVHSLTATATDVAGNESAASPALSVTIDTMAPTVTVNQGVAQTDPAAVGPVEFDILFSESVIGFDSSDVMVGGSIGGTPAVSGGPSAFTVFVVTFSTEGTVTASLPEAAAIDQAGNASTASTSTDNRVSLDTHGADGGSATPVILTTGVGMQGGWLESGDTDAFTFTLAEPRIAMIYTTGTVDTRGELRDALGTLLNDPTGDDDARDGTNFQILHPLAAGTYTVAVVANSGEGDYELHIEEIDTPRIQPDLKLNGRGDGVYDTLTGQIISLTSRKARPVRATVTVENDGEIHDSFTLSAGRGNTVFRVLYTNPDDGNITAGLIAGTKQTDVIDPDDPSYLVRTTISPNKRKITKVKKIRRRGRVIRKTIYLSKQFSTRFGAVSDALGTQKDILLIRVRTR